MCLPLFAPDRATTSHRRKGTVGRLARPDVSERVWGAKKGRSLPVRGTRGTFVGERWSCHLFGEVNLLSSRRLSDLAARIHTLDDGVRFPGRKLSRSAG